MSGIDQLVSEYVAQSPEFAKAYREAGERYERAVRVPCPFGRCFCEIDPLDGRIFGGVGDSLCGCDNLPGWRSSRYEGLPKPGWTGKARGRHGSRVQRSKHRRREWQQMVSDVEKWGRL